MKRFAIDVDGDGLGSIAVRVASRRDGTLRERFGGGGSDRLNLRYNRHSD